MDNWLLDSIRLIPASHCSVHCQYFTQRNRSFLCETSFFTKDSEHFYEEIWTFPDRYPTWRLNSEPSIYLDLNVFQWLLSYTKLLLIAIDKGPLMGAFSQNRSTGSEWIWWLHSESPGIKYLYCAVYLSIGGFYAALRMVFLQIIVNAPTVEIGSLPYYFADVRTWRMDVRSETRAIWLPYLHDSENNSEHLR